MSFEDRSNALIELLDELETRGVGYVLIGGYAVSAFNPRFSTDLDIVIAAEEKDDLVDFLTDRGFELQTEHDSEDWIYDREVEQYEKRLGPREPIGFDLLVNGLGCRQTDAEWSFDYLHQHSSEKGVSGGTRKTTARVVDGEVLVAVKLHSARATDLRDVIAIAPEIDLDAVTPHLDRGDADARRKQFQTAIERLDSDEFDQGYKSDFGTSSVSNQAVQNVKEFLEDQVERLS